MSTVLFSEIIQGCNAEMILDEGMLSIYYKGKCLKSYNMDIDLNNLDDFTKESLVRLNVYNYLDMEDFDARLFFDD